MINKESLIEEKLREAGFRTDDTDKIQAMEAFGKLYDTIRVLRSENGCPWDREQTPESLKEDLIEESYECVSAILDQDSVHLSEELGDVYLVATMMAYMNHQEGSFSVDTALEGVSEKLVRRHPHVFKDVEAGTPEEVLVQWNKIKKDVEGRKNMESLLSGVPKGVPPLDRSFRLQKKASKVGFDWPDHHGVIDKINEELEEVAAEIESGDTGALEEELGDLLFSAVNLCRCFKIDPSTALHGANRKFFRRFLHVEKRFREEGDSLGPEKIEKMEEYWQEAKSLEK